MTPTRRWLVAGLSLLCPAAAALAGTGVLSNDRYELALQQDGAVLVSRGGVAEPQRFEPRFVVMFRAEDPGLALRPAKIGQVSYSVPTWVAPEPTGESELAAVDTSVTAGDGFDERILKGDQKGRTPRYFRAAAPVRLTLRDARAGGDRITWRLASEAVGRLDAALTLPEGAGAPVLQWSFEPARDGWHSVGYVGAPAAPPDAVDEIFQPLLWNYTRFPELPFLTMAFRCTVPTAFVRTGDTTLGVAADPQHLPFQPLPRPENSQFGVMLRDADGNARPMCFAPVLGGFGSEMRAGTPFRFTMRLLVEPGSVDRAFEAVARDLLGYADFRRNTTHTLNQTLANMVAYGLSEYSRFNEELRGCSYATDVPGAVKNVSALHPLSVALVTDDAEVYRRRARPIIEYLMSREKFLFATSPEVKIQNPSWRLFGPCAPLSEFAALHAMTQGRNPLFLRLAEAMLGVGESSGIDVEREPDTWQNRLALYEASGDRAHLDRAVAQADRYLEAEVYGDPPSYDERGGFFWNAFVPTFYELLELYEATGETRYLAAAHQAARDYAQFVWVTPSVPDGAIVVNEGGVAPIYWYLKAKGHERMRAPQERVEAWRLSEIGLISESAGTSHGHRGVMMTNHAPWFLRIGGLTGDDFLASLGRHAVVGRYANFPGYHLNTARTTVYEKPDYPLREHEELSYNSFHYNHVWPHIALLIDYLVSDAVVRSEGAIDFPSRYAEGYGYLKNKVYGDRPGRFYGDEGVWLWMPTDLLEVDNVQLNHVAGRGNGALYVAFTNQSDQPVEATVRINPERVGLHEDGSPHAVRVWAENEPTEATRLVNGQLRIRVAPRGITAMAIDGVTITPGFQRAADSAPAPGSAGPAYVEQPFAEGTVGMLLSMGPDLTSGYVYLKGTFETIAEARLHYRAGDGPWQTVSDDAYPYEFTVDLPAGARTLTYSVETTAPDGTVERSEEAMLSR